MNEEQESEEVEELKEGSLKSEETASTAALLLEQVLCSPCSDFTAFRKNNGGTGDYSLSRCVRLRRSRYLHATFIC